MKISRKNFIVQTFSYFVTTATLVKNLKADTQKKIVILGGGLSGVYAAYKLEKLGYKVIIIEASSKLGGRIKTVKKNFLGNDFSLEFGAEYVSEGDTKLISLCKELKIDLKAIDFNLNIIDSNHKKVSFLDKSYFLESESLKKFNKLLLVLPKLNKDQLKSLDQINLYNYLKYQNLTKVDLENFNLFCLYYYGDSIQYLSAQKILSDISNFTSYKYKFSLGSESLIQKLIEQKNIEFNFLDPVIKVNQTSKEVKVFLNSGKVIKADLCFCSLPINQIMKIDWKPLLNRDKRLAFLKLRYSKISRSYFFLNQVFSNSSFAFLYNSYLNFIKQKLLIKDKYSILCAEYYNQIAISNEKMSIHEKEYMIKRIISKLNLIEDDFSVLQSIHSSDIYSEYIPCGKSIFSTNTFGVQDTLKKMEKRIFFIGEHLGKKTGTMEGALESVDMVLENL